MEEIEQSTSKFVTKIELLNYQLSNNKALVKLEDGITDHIDLLKEVLQKLCEDRVKIELLEEEVDNLKVSLKEALMLLSKKGVEIVQCNERMEAIEIEYEDKLKKMCSKVEKLNSQSEDNRKDMNTKIENFITEQETKNSNMTRKVNHLDTMLCSNPSVSVINPLAEEIARRIMLTEGNKWKKTRIVKKLKRFARSKK